MWWLPILRMPNKHGHAFVTHLLELEQRPVTVVHTGVIEPRLAKDLLARGIDDIVFKPFNFSILAAKVKALVERRFPPIDPNNRGARSSEDEIAVLSHTLLDESANDTPVAASDLEDKLSAYRRSCRSPRPPATFTR